MIFRCFRPSCGAIQCDVSLLPRGLCVVGKLGRTKKIAFGARWERGREKRVLCHMMCSSLSAVLAKPGDYLDAFERCCEDNSIKGVSILFHGFFTIHVFGAVVRHPIVPRALSIFSITAILIGIPSGSLCEGERSDVPFVRLGGHTQGTKLWYS